MNGKNWYSVYFSSHFKGTNGFLCDFSVLLYICFRQQVRNLVKMKKNIFCLLYFGRKIHFLKLSRRCRPPELASGSTIGEPSTDSRKSESNKKISYRFCYHHSFHLLYFYYILHITSHSDRSRRHPSLPCHSLGARSPTVNDSLLRISLTILAHTLEDIIIGNLARTKATLILARCGILASFRSIKSLPGIIPLFNMNDVNHLSQLRILEDGILHILVARQSHPDMLARLSLPFGNGLQPRTS